MSEDGVSLYRADDRLSVFPDPLNVFAARVEEHSRYWKNRENGILGI